MKIRKLLPITIALVVSSNANAALIERLNGLAYYDDVANLTWLTDANAAVGSAYDTYIAGSGRMNWSDANAWAADLSVEGVTGWRLANTDNCSGSNCSNSDMFNLYRNNFLDENSNYTDNINLFSNVSTIYWTAVEDASNTDFAWYFDSSSTTGVGTTFQSNNQKTTYLKAWAVRTGDVSPVPVPAAVWLFGSGLLGLAGLARRKKSV